MDRNAAAVIEEEYRQHCSVAECTACCDVVKLGSTWRSFPAFRSFLTFPFFTDFYVLRMFVSFFSSLFQKAR
jgi:hypothetical protein